MKDTQIIEDPDLKDPPFTINALLERCVGNPDVAKLVLTKFERQLDADLKALDISIGNRDYQKTKSIAHALRGASGIVGADGIVALLLTLGQMSDGQDLSLAPEIILQLRG